jgi:hypothetical protein
MDIAELREQNVALIEVVVGLWGTYLTVMNYRSELRRAAGKQSRSLLSACYKNGDRQ